MSRLYPKIRVTKPDGEIRGITGPVRALSDIATTYDVPLDAARDRWTWGNTYTAPDGTRYTPLDRYGEPITF